ncbi:hypothetical protein SISSUDRAFT_1130508 [Sistotremastrum suecicum HHB10207 ss-3]|uniref:Uncharacterized protein n=1 Tax=Sistotremastrum suecicum HHB10207 ss-3 TaxID=1314776 RepID=A0A166BCS8_9AGAM|nr:hypothetical protein SISSUDRAFT_1130508 [Sistotremastrum suecicum HHB10207 ss-3]
MMDRETAQMQRAQSQQARTRDRGGIFKPSEHNPFLSLLMNRKVSGQSPSPQKDEDEIERVREKKNKKKTPTPDAPSRRKSSRPPSSPTRAPDNHASTSAQKPSKTPKKSTKHSISLASHPPRLEVADTEAEDNISESGTVTSERSAHPRKAKGSKTSKPASSKTLKRSREPSEEDDDLELDDSPSPKKRTKTTKSKPSSKSKSKPKPKPKPKSADTKSKRKKTPTVSSDSEPEPPPPPPAENRDKGVLSTILEEDEYPSLAPPKTPAPAPAPAPAQNALLKFAQIVRRNSGGSAVSVSPSPPPPPPSQATFLSLDSTSEGNVTANSGVLERRSKPASKQLSTAKGIKTRDVQTPLAEPELDEPPSPPLKGSAINTKSKSRVKKPAPKPASENLSDDEPESRVYIDKTKARAKKRKVPDSDSSTDNDEERPEKKKKPTRATVKSNGPKNISEPKEKDKNRSTAQPKSKRRHDENTPPDSSLSLSLDSSREALKPSKTQTSKTSSDIRVPLAVQIVRNKPRMTMMLVPDGDSADELDFLSAR